MLPNLLGAYILHKGLHDKGNKTDDNPVTYLVSTFLSVSIQ